MTRLTDFLLARIEEDRLAAQAAADTEAGTWGTYFTIVGHEDGDGEFRDVKDDHATYVVQATDQAPTVNQAAHIARWNPARVMAECDAKEQLVRSRRDGSDEVEKQDEDLLALAKPYAEHVDYRRAVGEI